MSEITFEVGDQVILGEHQEIKTYPQSKNWVSSMKLYVGRVATIIGGMEVDSYGCMTYNVDVDVGLYHWRAINMNPIHRQQNKPVINGASCKKCNEFNSYADTVDYVCYSCRH